MAVTIPLTKIRELVWTALDADTNLQAFITTRGGREFKLDAGLDDGKVPMAISKDACPCLFLVPETCGITFQATRLMKYPFRLMVQGVVCSTDPSEAEEFYWLTAMALLTAFKLNHFGATQATHGAVIERMISDTQNFDSWYDQKNMLFFQQFMMPVTLELLTAL